MKISITKADQSKISELDFDNLEFGRKFTDHMVEATYSDGKWQTMEIKPYGPITFDPSVMALHYGQTIFEGMKAYYVDDSTINLFRPKDHLRRFNKSAKRLSMPEMDESLFLGALEELIKLDYEWVPKKHGQALYLRPVMFASEEYLVAKASDEYRFYLIASPVGAYYKEGFNPVKLTTTNEFVRAVEGGTGESKAGGNYGGSFLPAKKANEEGYTQVLWLDAKEHKYVEEVGTMNIFFLMGDKLITPKLSGSVLPGITRRSVITLATEWGIKAGERKILIDEIFEAHENGKLTEVFGTGTAAVISPVGLIHHNGRTLTLDQKNIGDFAKRTFDKITGIQYGKVDDVYNWTHPVRVK